MFWDTVCMKKMTWRCLFCFLRDHEKLSWHVTDIFLISKSFKIRESRLLELRVNIYSALTAELLSGLFIFWRFEIIKSLPKFRKGYVKALLFGGLADLIKMRNRRKAEGIKIKESRIIVPMLIISPDSWEKQPQWILSPRAVLNSRTLIKVIISKL